MNMIRFRSATFNIVLEIQHHLTNKNTAVFMRGFLSRSAGAPLRPARPAPSHRCPSCAMDGRSIPVAIC